MRMSYLDKDLGGTGMGVRVGKGFTGDVQDEGNHE